MKLSNILKMKNLEYNSFDIKNTKKPDILLLNFVKFYEKHCLLSINLQKDQKYAIIFPMQSLYFQLKHETIFY